MSEEINSEKPLTWGEAKQMTSQGIEFEQNDGQQNIEVEGDNIPQEIKEIIAEINGRVKKASFKKQVAEWMNRVMDATQKAIMSELPPMMLLPRDSKGDPCKPGDVLEYLDGQRVTILAIDPENVYYNVDGGSIPTGFARADQFRHAYVMSLEECLWWFEENIAAAGDEAERKTVYDSCIKKLRDAFEFSED